MSSLLRSMYVLGIAHVRALSRFVLRGADRRSLTVAPRFHIGTFVWSSIYDTDV